MNKYDLDKLIGSKILSIRKSKNITRIAVADYLQVSKVHVHNIETGYYSTGIFNFIKMCEILDCSLEDIFPTKEELDLLKYIKVNQVYSFYDDGKINLSRRYYCKLLEIIPFVKAELEVIQEWEHGLEYYPELYNKTISYFLKCELYLENNDKEILYFVRNLENGWTSIDDIWTGDLDYNGEITKQLENNV